MENMGKVTFANLKKTIYYLRRNGLRSTWNAARERLAAVEAYAPKAFSGEELAAMRREAAAWIREAEAPFFHVLVPAYRTDPKFLRELVESVRAQVYPRWELLLLDATEGEEVRAALREICGEVQGVGDERAETDGAIRYVQLPQNGGISENTNAGLPYVHGGYVGLLDHDDVLTPDALYEMAATILASKGEPPAMLYSDEDKWDGAGKYYERNRKEDFNLDLLLSNNYICHFLVMKTELMQELRLRKEYDGAQDYDLVLRAAARILAQGGAPEKEIRHIPEVLYHWRCHEGSTAENPKSKLYAYEAGRRALQDFANAQGWQATAEDLKHVGFYRLRFESIAELLRQREDLGAVGGKLLRKNGQGMALAGGRMAADGGVYYEGLKEGYSGYLHRGVLTQDAEAVDLRCVCVAREFWPLFEQVTGVPYQTREVTLQGGSGKEGLRLEIFDCGKLPMGADVKELSLSFCKALRDRGKRILWDSEMSMRL